LSFSSPNGFGSVGDDISFDLVSRSLIGGFDRWSIAIAIIRFDCWFVLPLGVGDAL
jgi:hypothetical protein